MPDQDTVEVEGRIVAVLPGTMFRVELTNGHQVLAHISGKLRKHFIRITVGDVVRMEMNTHDLEKARITFRLRNTDLPPAHVLTAVPAGIAVSAAGRIFRMPFRVRSGCVSGFLAAACPEDLHAFACPRLDRIGSACKKLRQ